MVSERRKAAADAADADSSASSDDEAPKRHIAPHRRTHHKAD
jgi:hypothetical protein